MNRREALKFVGAGLGFLFTGVPALAKKEDRFKLKSSHYLFLNGDVYCSLWYKPGVTPYPMIPHKQPVVSWTKDGKSSIEPDKSMSFEELKETILTIVRYREQFGEYVTYSKTGDMYEPIDEHETVLTIYDANTRKILCPVSAGGNWNCPDAKYARSSKQYSWRNIAEAGSPA